MEKQYHRLEKLEVIITEKLEGEPLVPKKIINCMDCEHHLVLPDPDLKDDFCIDDEKVFCNLAKKYITTACRPHHKRDECQIPAWCPLLQVNQAR